MLPTLLFFLLQPKASLTRMGSFVNVSRDYPIPSANLVQGVNDNLWQKNQVYSQSSDKDVIFAKVANTLRGIFQRLPTRSATLQ
jgi:hypothetical protein